MFEDVNKILEELEEAIDKMAAELEARLTSIFGKLEELESDETKTK